MLSFLGGLMAHATQLLIRLPETIRSQFLDLHESLSAKNPVGVKNYGDTLEALLKANAGGSEKTLRVVELEAQLLNVDEAFRQAVKEHVKALRHEKEKTDRAVGSRKAAHNKYHALIRHIKNNLPRPALLNLNLSKFMEEPQQHFQEPETRDQVGEQLDYLVGGEPE